MAAGELQQATALPLRASLRSEDDPKQCIATAMGVLRMMLKVSKKSYQQTQGWPNSEGRHGGGKGYGDHKKSC